MTEIAMDGAWRSETAWIRPWNWRSVRIGRPEYQLECATDYPPRGAILGKYRKHPVHGLQKF